MASLGTPRTYLEPPVNLKAFGCCRSRNPIMLSGLHSMPYTKKNSQERVDFVLFRPYTRTQHHYRHPFRDAFNAVSCKHHFLASLSSDSVFIPTGEEEQEKEEPEKKALLPESSEQTQHIQTSMEGASQNILQSGEKKEVVESQQQMEPEGEERDPPGKRTDRPLPFEENHKASQKDTAQNGVRKTTCMDCGKSFIQSSKHLKRQKSHTKEAPFLCFSCGQSFRRSSGLVTHERISVRNKPYTCSDCGKSFFLSSSLLSHERFHTGEKPYKCTDCGKCFVQRTDLLRHQRSHRKEKPYQCSGCEKSFTRSTGVRAHEKLHMAQQPYACSECGKGFIQSSRLLAHERMHASEKLSKCSVRRNSLDYLKPYINPSGERLYACTDCGKSFDRRSNLIIHERIHTGEKPYPCSACKKRFISRSNLMSHERSHTGEKPFKCLDCGKNFGSRSNLLRHEAIHAGGGK